MKQGIVTVGLDLAKNVFQVHAIDGEGKILARRQLRRAEVLKFFSQLQSCLIGMEACASVHYWARELIGTPPGAAALQLKEWWRRHSRMTSDTTMPKVSTLEVIQTGSRRRWTVEAKQRIVADSFGAPRLVSATARRYGLSSAQLFQWRRQAREGKLAVEGGPAGFVPAMVVADKRADESPGSAQRAAALFKGRKGSVRG